MFCNIINVTFEQFNMFLINKSIIIIFFFNKEFKILKFLLIPNFWNVGNLFIYLH